MKDIYLRRSIAFLIDMGIISLMVSIFENLLPVTIQAHDFAIFGIRLTPGISLSPVFYILYFTIFDIVAGGRTTGKSIMGIVVVSEFGEKLSVKKLLLRSFYKTVSVFILPVSIFLFICREYYTLQEYFTDTDTIRSR